MRTQTVDPACARPPWAGLTPTKARAWIDQAGGIDAAADLILSFGHPPRYQSNRDFREMHTQGPSFEFLENRLSGNSVDGAEDEDEDRPEETETETETNAAYDGADEHTKFEISGATPSDPIGLGFATAEAFCTDTKRARGGPARAMDRNAWNAILALYPLDGTDRGVLVASAQCGAWASKQIGTMVGLSGRRVRGIQDQKLQWALANLTAADLRAHRDDPITTERVTPRAPSLAGRKPKKAIATRIPRFLVLAAA